MSHDDGDGGDDRAASASAAAAADPHVAHLQIFPIKSLDPETPERVELGAGGALVGDREWAVVEKSADAPHDPDEAALSAYVNGKKTDRVHRLRTAVDVDAATVSIRRSGEDAARTFDLDEPAELNDWLGDYFERTVSVRRADGLGFPDRRDESGPTVVSTATLSTVAEWFGFDVPEARRRFRANVEIGGVPPFWEDRLFADEGEVVAVRVGDAVLEGIAPVGRCVVPGRDADTGVETPNFREAFVERRRAASPDWTDSGRYDHDYHLAVTTRAAESERGKRIALGDEVGILGVREQ